MYTIKHAADLTGVPVATLRAWERRYGVVVPRRTNAGYRLYDERVLGIITAMHDLVRAGWSPRQAAAEVERSQAAGAAADTGRQPPAEPRVPERETSGGAGARP
ncbi:MAG: MerR family transcriptional regulator, partial [Dactylosporangium sp.]|nr:MerR family transcriptional regulator [Dactylosporangium sp.]NNJ63149.1 MerR family transcriptional regulator [Dactylosporangium sp.]